ncbi:replication factor C subunit 5-like [Amphibalanus amphitrite]|uniref:replication factor C subunit 5-like n=1 Tax=Amphibalanus amphitrite TaxID=1232801 RepID=UPI001C92689D|nr:replication factor C subunit 5-like [Amphibalanus amphitrite]XP_043225532.1 replication factor C subunit 5-like [Amphibalanus amphitrite]XP_043225541.1 replication factor C subunit 5-like [Amphibalanus amphitrite]XP_043225549.1 replication factor C subunit 5-like [Amphibalanus amphitrite]XP_043225557.1 replication factor C subunit 5-like [Amphibalanus amphitrite]
MVQEEKTDNLPWVEKYRPKQLSDLISHEEIIKTIGRFMKEDALPHLLFYGPPGTGKTSTILACAKQLYKPSEFQAMVLELNASDDRGIGAVRNQIQSFASTRTIFNRGFKLIILDEADAMTKDAQNALRRIIEKYTDNVRFCLICNYLSKIIPAIQSRCTRFRFGPLATEQVAPRLDHVVKQEGVDLSPDGRQALLDLAGGDMRRVLNILQATAIAFGSVTEDNVYTCIGHPHSSDITAIVNWMLNEDMATALRKIVELKTHKGLALQDVLTEVHKLVHRIDLPSTAKCDVLYRLGEIEHHLSRGATESLQLAALVAAFQIAKHQVAEEAGRQAATA